MTETSARKDVVNIGGGYFYKSYLTELEKELQEKANRVRIGYEKFSKADQFAFMLLSKYGYFDS